MAVVAYDTFTGTAGTVLSAHTSDSGHTWVRHTTYPDELVLTNANRLRTDATASVRKTYYCNVTPSGAEYDVLATVTDITTTANDQIGPAGRVSSSTASWYDATRQGNGASAGTITLGKKVNGTSTTLGTYTHAESVGQETEILLQIRDATKKAFVNGVEQISSTDNAITDAGFPGVRGFDTGSDTAGVHLDDWIFDDPGATAQLLQPDETVTVNTWTTDTGGTTNLHLAVDEATPGSDADYIQSALAPTGTSPVELGLPTPATPGTGVRSLRYRRQQSPSSTRAVNLTASLYRGATLVQAFSDNAIPSAWVETIHILTSDPAGWDDLRVRFAATQAAPPAPTLVGSSATAAFTATSGATLAPALPVGWAADDIHVLLVHRSDNTAITTPAGWTKITPSGAAETNTAAQIVSVYWRRAVAGDTAPTITAGSGTVVRGARIIGIRGCPTTGDPFDATIRENVAAPANANVVSSGVTTTVDNTLALFMYAYEDDPSTASQPTNWSTVTVAASALGADMALGYATRTMATAGATGTVTTTVATGTFANSPHAVFVLALKPAAGTEARAQISWIELQVPSGTGPTSHDLTATGSVAATLTGVATRDHPISASGGLTASLTGAAVSAHPLTATGSAAASLAAATVAAHPLTATGSAATALTATVITVHPLSATGSAAATLTGAATTPGAAHPLTATGSLTASVTAAATRVHPLTATGSASASVTAEAAKALPLTATGSVAASVTASSRAAHPLEATGSSAVSVTAAARAAHPLSATGSATVSVTATNVGTRHPLTATGGASATLTGNAIATTPGGHALEATGSVAASLAAISTIAHPLAATGSLAASIDGAALADHPLSAMGSVEATAAAIVRTAHPLSATGGWSMLMTAVPQPPDVVGSLTGQLLVEPLLSGRIMGERLLDGDLEVERILSGILEAV